MNINKKNRVAADPAKGFFVTMLIKDITLRDAIGDLVDNSVDAIKSRAQKLEDLSRKRPIYFLARKAGEPITFIQIHVNYLYIY